MSAAIEASSNTAQVSGRIPLLVQILLRLDRDVDRSIGLTLGVLDGLRLGLLSDSTLAAIDEAYYLREAKYVDSAYNRQGLSIWERSAFDAYFFGCRSIAVTSAGGGREVIALLDGGIAALGFEPNADLVEFGNALAQGLGHGRPLKTVERDTFPVVGEIDGLIVGWGGYMLVRGRQQRVQFLQEAAAALPEGAPVLLSFFLRRGDTLRFRISHRLGNMLSRLRRGRSVELGDAMSPNYVHFFTRSEVLREMRDGGFEPIAHGNDGYGWLVGRRKSLPAR